MYIKVDEFYKVLIRDIEDPAEMLEVENSYVARIRQAYFQYIISFYKGAVVKVYGEDVFRHIYQHVFNQAELEDKLTFEILKGTLSSKEYQEDFMYHCLMIDSLYTVYCAGAVALGVDEVEVYYEPSVRIEA